jgi:hypothetical protein
MWWKYKCLRRILFLLVVFEIVARVNQTEMFVLTY